LAIDVRTQNTTDVSVEMPRFLCISVTFLDAFFHGQGDGGSPEWPPSPMRLFQAMLAGSRMGARKLRWTESDRNSLRDAFLWLERQSAPVIIAPAASVASAYTLFVPNNDSDAALDRQDRLTTKFVRPQRLARSNEPDGLHTLHYLWDIPEVEWGSSRRLAAVLAQESRHLMALGWGIDQVMGRGAILKYEEAGKLIGERWQPWDSDQSGGNSLRVPIAGSLDDLEAVYESFRGQLDGGTYNPPQLLKRFAPVRYVRSTESPHRPHARLELPEGIAFRQEATIQVAAMLRSLACREQNRNDFRNQFGEDTEIYLAGHLNGGKFTPPRFSYLPLPTIGHEHADGMIRRVLIVEPYGGDGLRARWAQRRLQGQALVDNDGNERGRLLELWRKSSGNLMKHYVGESQFWSTVTPVILPGYDDGRLVKAEKLFLQAVEQADLQTDGIADFTLRRAPFWPGSQHPRHYHRPRYLRHLPAWHVQLTFREPVSGPLAVGAGRHIGLGLMSASGGRVKNRSPVPSPPVAPAIKD